MPLNPFAGVWTYRSFHNKPLPVESFEDIRLWQAKLTLNDDGGGLVSGTLADGPYNLEVRGAIESAGSGEHRILFRATGVAGSATDGWRYDYRGALLPRWPDGNRERPAIVGTVTRTLPHAPQRLAGEVYSFVAVNQTRPADAYRLPEPVIAHFADRVHRLHHSVWHALRMSWNNLSPASQKALAALDWEVKPPHVALFDANAKTRPCLTNGSGEDFLFFHRQMVVHYKAMMASAGQAPLEWRELPQPGAGGDGSPDVVPGAWTIADSPPFERRLRALKTDEFFWSRMRWWDAQFKDPTQLSNLTLAELGSMLEFGVHNDMHIRWSAVPRHPVTNEVQPTGRPAALFTDAQWDLPAYDWLGEFYSSHVNPVFWRLHGWIDDRITDWYDAQQWKHPNQVKRVSMGGVDWFEGKPWVVIDRPWVWPDSLGGFEGGHGGHGHDDDLNKRRVESMLKVVAILFPQATTFGVETGAATGTDWQRSLTLVGF